MRRERARKWACALALLAAVGLSGCPRQYTLPAPDPLPDRVTGGLSEGRRARLADVRRFLSPADQQLVERTLARLADDPRLDRDATQAAIGRAVHDSGVGTAGVSGFCDNLARALEPLRYAGPPADAPDAVALAVPIDRAHERWLSDAGRDRYDEPLDLARALRDGELAPDAFDASVRLPADGGPLFVTEASVFEGPGPSAARRMCLETPPAHSFVIAEIPVGALSAPLRVPTAADAGCRPHFQVPPEGARAGVTCSGNPEYVTAPIPLSAVSHFRLAR